jgi:hypothetical protein
LLICVAAAAAAAVVVVVVVVVVNIFLVILLQLPPLLLKLILLQLIIILVVVVALLLLLLLVTPLLSGIVTFASATDIAMIKATTTIDTFCITDGPQESDFNLENSFLITTLLPNPEDKSAAKNVAQKIQKFYLTNTSSSVAVFSSASDVRNKLLFSSHITKFSMSV